MQILWIDTLELILFEILKNTVYHSKLISLLVLVWRIVVKWKHEWTNKWMNEWVDEWKDRWMKMKISLWTFHCIVFTLTAPDIVSGFSLLLISHLEVGRSLVKFLDSIDRGALMCALRGGEDGTRLRKQSPFSLLPFLVENCRVLSFIRAPSSHSELQLNLPPPLENRWQLRIFDTTAMKLFHVYLRVNVRW